MNPLLRILKDQRGVTLVQLMFIVVVSVGLVTSVATYVVQYSKQKDVAEEEANVTQLESLAKTYSIEVGSYPVKDAVKLSEQPQNSPLKNLFDAFKDLAVLTDAEIDNRFKVVDTGRLNMDNYLATEMPDNSYVIDLETGKVISVATANEDLTAFTELAKSMLSISGDLVDLKTAGTIDIKTATANMQKINAMELVGNKLIVGGQGGTMQLAILTISESDGSLVESVDNKTSELTGANPVVNEIKYLGSNNVLIHYYDGTSPAYKTLTIN